jgi:hypothetical protein
MYHEYAAAPNATTSVTKAKYFKPFGTGRDENWRTDSCESTEKSAIHHHNAVATTGMACMNDMKRHIGQHNNMSPAVV